MEPGVYLIKERTVDEHELHNVFDGERWYFGAAGVSGALQIAELGLKSGEYKLTPPASPIRREILRPENAERLATLVAHRHNIEVVRREASERTES